MIYLIKHFSLYSVTSGNVLHLLHDVSDPSFRDYKLSATSVYVSKTRRVGEHRLAISLHVAHSFAAVRRCSFRIDRIGGGVTRERPEGIRATRCQLPYRSHCILRDTSSREDDYVHGSTRRLYTFPLNQPLTSPRMHRAHRSTIDKRPRKATQFNRRRCDSFVGERERKIPRCVRDGEDIRARNGWEKYVRILARSAP